MHVNGVVEGPYDLAQITTMWSCEVVNGNTRALREGTDEWTTLARLLPNLRWPLPMQAALEALTREVSELRSERRVADKQPLNLGIVSVPFWSLTNLCARILLALLVISILLGLIGGIVMLILHQLANVSRFS